MYQCIKLGLHVMQPECPTCFETRVITHFVPLPRYYRILELGGIFVRHHVVDIPPLHSSACSCCFLRRVGFQFRPTIQTDDHQLLG
jgi:hypothetical protein